MHADTNEQEHILGLSELLNAEAEKMEAWKKRALAAEARCEKFETQKKKDAPYELKARALGDEAADWRIRCEKFEKALREWDKEAKALPLGAASRSKGDSLYNHMLTASRHFHAVLKEG